MRSSFTEEEVISMLSYDHRLNTAVALRKSAVEITAEELIRHWLSYHPMGVTHFIVVERDGGPTLFGK